MTDGTESRRGERWPAIVIAVALVAMLIAVQHLWPTNRGLRLNERRSKLHDINIALVNYVDDHGELPYDERGEEYALYKLRDWVDADRFHLNDATEPPPYWDHTEERLVGGDVMYLNADTADPGPCVVLIGVPYTDDHIALLGWFGGPVSVHTFPSQLDRNYLGTYRLWPDDCHVVGRDLYQDLTASRESERRENSSWTTHGSSRIHSAFTGDLSLRFEYWPDGNIHQCVFTTPRGEVVEIYETDSLGRIIGVERTPDGWREILGMREVTN